MKSLFPFLLIGIFCFFGCKKNIEVREIPLFVLTGTISPTDTTHLLAVIQTGTSSFFADTIYINNGAFEIKHPADSMVRINLLTPGKTFSVYMNGGDSLQLNIQNDSMQVVGKVKPFALWSIENYLTGEKDSLGHYPAIIRNEIQQYKERTNQVRLNEKIPYALFRDSKGNNFTTLEAKGNYRLITCWAGWDSTSMAQIKEVARIARKMESKAIEFINISFDENDSIWKEQIDKLKLPGKNVRMLEGFASQNAQKLGITTIPTNMLLNPESVLIRKNLFGTKLEDFLKEEVKAAAKKDSKTAYENKKSTSSSAKQASVRPVRPNINLINQQAPRMVNLKEKNLTN